MKKLTILVLLTFVLTSCGMFERGNYDKDRTGYVLSGDLLVSYHTNSVGEIDIFMIDQVMSFLEAYDYSKIETDVYTTNSVEGTNNLVSLQDLSACSVSYTSEMPRFIRIDDKTYYFNVRDSGYCTFDEYVFHPTGYTEDEFYEIGETTPLEELNITLFKEADFKVNTFETVIFVENIYFDSDSNTWKKEIISALPMSIRQAGNVYEDNTDFIEQVTVLEKYVLDNQSINLLTLREDYNDEDVNQIWSDETINRLGRDHDIIKSVRIKKTGDILEIINDTLSRLGMFS